MRYNEYIKGKENPTNQKGSITMKKTTMNAIANYIKNVPELATEYAELCAEMNKGAEKAAANRELYANAHDAVLANITSEPKTIAEIWEACADVMPEGFTKNKVQYALLHYWNDEVAKDTDGKVNTYRLA